MSINKITYSDKQAINTNPALQAINKVQDVDMNEIKSVVNTNADLMGDLTTLTTTDKTSVVNAINELNGRNILTATIGSDITLSNTSDAPLTLSLSNSVGNLLSVSNGGVVIGDGVHKVLICGKGQYNVLANSTSARYFKIKKNNTEVLVCKTSSPSNTGTLNVAMPNILLSVNSGDIITASVQGASGDVIRSGVLWTNITIEVVS